MKKRRGRPKKAPAKKPNPDAPVTAEEEVFVNSVEQNVDEIGVPNEVNENGVGQFDAAKEFSSSLSPTSSSSDGGGSFHTGEDSDSFDEPETGGKITISVNKHGRPQLIREEATNTPAMSQRGVDSTVLPSKEKHFKAVSSRGFSRPRLPSVKKPSQDPRYNKAELQACLAVIKKIMQMEEAVSFCSPIDPISQGIPDYFSVIDRPMDFGTICNNLQNDVKYMNSDDVYKDVDIIWENCIKYNKKGDYIIYLMRRVKKKFMKYWTEAGLRTEMQRRHDAPPSVHTMRQSRHEAMSVVDNMVDSYQNQPRVHQPSYAHPYMSHQPLPGASLMPPYSQFHAGVGSKYTGHSYRPGPTYSQQQQPQLSSRYMWQSHHTTSQPQPSQSHFRTDTNNTGHQQSLHLTDDGVTHNGYAPKSSMDPMISSKGHPEPHRQRKRKHRSSSHHEPDRSNLPQASTVPSQPSHSAASADVFSPVSNEVEGSQRKGRGRTKMADVHARRFEDRKLIPLNDQFQPVSSDPKLISEFSRFLGTLARQFVPLTYVSWHKVPDKNNLWAYVKEKYIIAEEGKAWVLRTIRESWKSYKSRIKKTHYACYDNDDARLKNKPSDVPLEEFRALLAYWGNSKVKETAERNSESRRKIVETHTAGPRSFAQISMEMQLANENGQEPSKAELYIATRKRKDGHDYKSPTDMIKNKISTLEEMCSSGANRESVEQLVFGDTLHWNSRLVGRSGLRRKKLRKVIETSETSADLEQLTSRIKQNLQSQMEETINKKVEEKMALLMKKLAESNPGLAINMVVHQVSSDHEVSSENDDVSS